MNLWYKKPIALIFGITLLLVGQYFLGTWFNTVWSSPCQGTYYGSIIYCHSPYMGIGSFGLSFNALGQILNNISIIFILAGFFLLFATARAFHEWVKFSYWYISIAVLIILIMYPSVAVPDYGDMQIIQGIDMLTEPYIIITLYIVARGVISFVKQKFAQEKTYYPKE